MRQPCQDLIKVTRYCMYIMAEQYAIEPPRLLKQTLIWDME
jgi:hypothetical protein